MRARQGSVVLDKRSNVWNFFWWSDGKRHSKVLGKFPTKIAAWKAAKPLRDAVEGQPKSRANPTVQQIVEQYRREKMPERADTRRTYEVWIKGHILPKWGACEITDLQARPVELWLQSLALSPKSKSHIRGLMHRLVDFAMWSGCIPTERNPLSLVTVKGATRRIRQPRSLTVAEYQEFAQHLDEPFRTMALLCVCFGLRISECLALKWSDVDWLKSTLTVTRSIVYQNVDDVKTAGSRKTLPVASEVLAVLKAWKQASQFSSHKDWMFASPVQLGRLPWSFNAVQDRYQHAAKDAGIGHLSTHTMRHTFRSWLDAVGTSVAVQQKAMRHADIRTTMNTYGDVVTDELVQAGNKVAALAIQKGER